MNSASRRHLRFRRRLPSTVISRRPSPCARSQTRPSWPRTQSSWNCARLRRARGRGISRRNLAQWRPEQIRPSHRRPRPRRPPRLWPLRHLGPRLTQPPPPTIIHGRIHPRPSKPSYKLGSSDPVQVENSLGDCLLGAQLALSLGALAGLGQVEEPGRARGVNQYKCIGCSPGKHPDTRTMESGSDDDSRGSAHGRCLCIAVWPSEPPRRHERQDRRRVH